MRTYTIWTDDNFIKLDNLVKEYKNNNLPVLHAFKKMAYELKLNPLTLRNLYYKKMKEQGVLFSKNIHHFTKVEEDILINDISNLIQHGYSIRRACMNLANHDKALFLRYQNKYRTYIKNKSINENIIPFKIREKQILSDGDISNLVFGLINLIKKNTIYEMDKKYKETIFDYQTRLNNTILELKKKNSLILEILKVKENISNPHKLEQLLRKIKINDDIHTIKEI